MTFAAHSFTEQKTTRPTPVTEQSKRSKRTLGEDPAPAPGHNAQHVPRDYKTINGWGADLDPANRPAVPRELPSQVMTVRGDVKHRQVPRTRIHCSNEHPDLTPVFGESCPPHGLSGAIRDFAYQYGEATNRHWMTLMFADRVDIIESAIADLFRGKPDNYVREKGWSARFRYAKTDERSHTALWIGAGVVGAVVLGLVVANAMREE